MPWIFQDDPINISVPSTIETIIPENRGATFINYYNSATTAGVQQNSTLATNLNPHIGDHDTVIIPCTGTTSGTEVVAGNVIREGDIIQLHSDDETYDARVTSYDRSNAEASVTILDVADPIVYPNTRITANTTNVIHSGNDAIITLPDDGNAPTETFTLANYDDIFQSWSVSAIGADGASISFGFNRAGTVNNLPVGFAGISFNHTLRRLIFDFEDARGNTAAENSTEFGQLFDGTTDLVGTDDHFFIEFSYHDHDAITEYSWIKPLKMVHTDTNITAFTSAVEIEEDVPFSLGENAEIAFIA